MKPVPIALFVQEVRRQVETAYDYIPYIKREFIENKSSKGLNPRIGSATFFGETKLIQGIEGDILAIIPFTGYLGSLLKPRLLLSSEATSTQTTTLEFKVIPRDLYDESKTVNWNEIDLCQVDVTHTPLIKKQDIITRTLIAAFYQIASIPNPSACNPREYNKIQLTNNKITLDFTFSVKRVNDADLGIIIVPSAPGLTSITGDPLLGVECSRTGTYSLKLEVPLIVDDANDSRRIYAGNISSSSQSPSGHFSSVWSDIMLIEYPYIEEEAKNFKSSLENTYMYGSWTQKWLDLKRDKQEIKHAEQRNRSEEIVEEILKNKIKKINDDAKEKIAFSFRGLSTFLV